MPELRMMLLGPPRIEIDGRPLTVDTRKAIALLAYLATSGAHTRDTLAALLWPDSDPTRARSALRRTLSVLNKGLGGGWLLRDGQQIGLAGEDRWCDVEVFTRLARAPIEHGHPTSELCADCLTALERAADLHTGDLLDGFSLRDSPAFEDWQFVESERLRRELAGVLDRLINTHARNRDFDAAVRYAERRIGLDHLHEPTHRRLMLLHAWSGRRGQAIGQYRDCVAALGRELGVAPLEQTTALYESVLAGTPPEAPPAVPAQATGAHVAAAPAETRPPIARPFVGRDPELGLMLRSHDESDGGQLFVVEGELGIGKSRLLTELIAAAGARGSTALLAKCHEDEHELPYTVITDLLRSASDAGTTALTELSPAWRRELAPLAPDVFPVDEPSSSGRVRSAEARRRLFEGLRHAVLAATGGGSTGLLIIDDAQWADGASLDALTHLCRRLHGEALSVVLAWRTEAVPNGHRLRRLSAQMREADRGLHIRLDRLDRTATAELVEASGVAAQPELVERLHAETEGIPLFLVEYLREIATRGPDQTDSWAVPVSIRDLLGARLAALSGVARQVLGAAAAIGRSFDLATVRAVSGRGDEELAAALEELVAAGIVVEIDPTAPRTEEYDFRHDRLRAIAYEETSLARRRLLHSRIAAAFDHPARPVEPTSQALIAHHLRLAAQDREAARRFVAAAERARMLAAPAEAISYYQAALDLGHEDPAELHAAIGHLHTLLGAYTAAIDAYEAAAALTTDPIRSAQLALGLAQVHGRRGDWPAVDALVDNALATIADAEDDHLRARLLIERAIAAHRLGHDADARRLADEALRIAAEVGEATTLAQAHNVHGMLARNAGDLDVAATALDRSLELASELADRAAQVAAMNNLALVAHDRGETPRGLELAKTALAYCRSLGDRHREAALLNNLADLLHAAGQEDEALSHVKESVAIFAEVGEPATLEPEIWKLVDW